MTVHLVGAGPGSADLLTLRALRLIESADVVVHDRLIDDSVLALVPTHVECIDVGKVAGRSHTQASINSLLIDLGKRYANVVRLKGGDPYLFGRGGEEAAALAEHGIEWTITPGVTSALSAPAAAGIPTTHRHASAAVTVVTGHRTDGAEPVDWQSLARVGGTIVVLMGVERRGEIADELLVGGLSALTPVAVIEAAWTSCQRIVRATLGELGGLKVEAPATIVIGAVAAIDLSGVTPQLLELVPAA
jgi:uroporphyrinogen III methyltransferase / synthase